MAATGPEQNGGNNVNAELDALRAEVAKQNARQLAEEVRKLATKASEVRAEVERLASQGKSVNLEGDKAQKDSPKGKAIDVKQTVQKILLAARTPDKMPLPEGKDAAVTNLSSQLLKNLSMQVSAESDISENTAPYIHELINKTINGELTSVDDMAAQLNKLQYLSVLSPVLYEKVQNSLVETAKQTSSLSEEELKTKFGVERKDANEDMQTRTGRNTFEGMWNEHYSTYFDTEDKPFVASLYSPVKFVEFVDGMKGEIAARLGKDRNSQEVRVAASKEIERKTVELFGKLYTRLDHEKPSEFFHEIEQQDIMRGILPVKNALKQRMIHLANELERAEREHKIENPGLFMRVEVKNDVLDLEYETIDKEKRVKPRVRLNPYTKPHEVEAGHFIHYLDQIVDHYIEARKYTHNARAIFLHPVDPEKGFYSQLSQFANDMTTVDFDQMMALPDNEVFRDAFALYDKMVDETFASNDWRHFPTMFELKQNSLHTQVEEDVLDKLKLMYKGNKEMSDARLEAALSMAVGASRGMFLNEIEKAAFADPHLNEDGTPTFASYYNQDVSALLAFNPMHQHFRWQAPNTMDPILFMPVEGIKGSSGYFTDHNKLWKKMQAYRDTFINGRGKTNLEGETLWTDFLVNIGKVGGPLQRKGWRTTYMLEPLYIRDEGRKDKLGYDYFKTFQRFENIGYEVVQDFVSKLPPEFTREYSGRHKGDAKFLQQKNDMFRYIYQKYFDGNPKDFDSYYRELLNKAEAGVIKDIKAGKAAPEDIRAQAETNASADFLNRALARLVFQRIPSKVLRIDRDRLSKDGVSRWRKIANDLGLSTRDFDAAMQDLLMAEQLLRKEVSGRMRSMVDAGRESWEMGSISYRLTEAKINDLLKDKMADDPARLARVKEVFKKIQDVYGKPDFLDKTFAGAIKPGEYKFSFALDEVDMSFIPWRGAGARVLPRAIGDISAIEKSVAAEVIKLPKVLHQISIDGKHDFTPAIEIMTKVYGALDGIIGTDYAHRVVHHMAGLTINYFKKDVSARALYGLFGIGQKNSLAAERAGGSARVWEWDSVDIDRFCVALEARAILPRDPFSTAVSKPTYTPVYMKIPFTGKLVKLPQSIEIGGKKIRLFGKRKHDFEFTTKQLRRDFGGNWKDISFDYLNKYLPLVIAWLLWKYMSDALKEAEGKKK